MLDEAFIVFTSFSYVSLATVQTSCLPCMQENFLAGLSGSWQMVPFACCGTDT